MKSAISLDWLYESSPYCGWVHLIGYDSAKCQHFTYADIHHTDPLLFDTIKPGVWEFKFENRSKGLWHVIGFKVIRSDGVVVSKSINHDYWFGHPIKMNPADSLCITYSRNG